MRRPGGQIRGAGAAALLAMLLGLACAERPRAERPAEAPAAPSPAATGQQGDPCASAATQMEMTACRAQAAKTAEALEEAQYAAALKALETKGALDQKGLLETAEQTWKQYRDAQCQAASGLYAGGSVAAMIAADCRARLANQRAAELKVVYLDWAAQ